MIWRFILRHQQVIGAIALALSIAGAVAGFIWWIDSNAAERTRGQIEAARMKSQIALRSDLRQSEQRLAGTIHQIAAQVGAQIETIESRHQTIIRPTLVRELTRETRLSDPAAGITDGVRAQLNRSLPPVACSARPAGGIRCTLPDARSADDQ